MIKQDGAKCKVCKHGETMFSLNKYDNMILNSVLFES